MRITNVTGFSVHPGWRKNLIFVKVETDAGITGWGEAYSQYDRDRAVLAQVSDLGRYAVGRNPFDIKHFTLMAFDDFAQRRGSLELFCAISGIEQALWDIVGKACNQPVYNLLGGRYRDRIRVYANGWSYGLKAPADYARAAERVIQQGFTALKFDPLPAPWRTYIPKEHERRAVEVVRAVRSAVGPDVDILIEQHRRLAPMHSIRLGQRLAEFDLYLVRGTLPRRQRRGAGRGAAADLPARGHRRSAVCQSGLPPGVRPARGRHHQSGRGLLRRHPGVEGNRRDGGDSPGCVLAAQLQLHAAGAGGNGAGVGDDAELHHHRVFPAVRRFHRHDLAESAEAGERLHQAADRAGAGRGRGRGRAAQGCEAGPYPLRTLRGPEQEGP